MKRTEWKYKLFRDDEAFINWLNEEGLSEDSHNYLRDQNGQPLLKIIPTNDSCIEVVYLIEAEEI